MGQRDGSIRFEHDRWFEMERVLVWEGGTSERVFVRTGSGGGDCGYAFALGGLYLVYAHGDRDTLNTGICMRTRPWTSAYEDSVALGAPKFDRTSGIPWRLLAPPVSCPVHRDVPVRRDHSIVAYGMAERVMENYAERMSREFPYAGIQFEFARADSGRTEFTDAYTCPTCRSIAKAWCRKQHVFLIADGDKPWELPLPTPAR
jgi:hypothetical protein